MKKHLSAFAIHFAIWLAVLFAVYPVLWVVSLAFSGDGGAPEPLRAALDRIAASAGPPVAVRRIG